GFLPRKATARSAVLAGLADEKRTVIVYESPNRLLDTLKAVLETLGERPLCVARELSKVFEEFVRGTASEVITHFEANPPRGEIVLVIGGAADENAVWDEARVRETLLALLEGGDSLNN